MPVGVGRILKFRPVRGRDSRTRRTARPGESLIGEVHLYSDQRLSIYYAPFDHVNKRVRLVLVGVTSGLRQMELAYRAARHGLLIGDEREAVLASVKRAASFAGAMRSNLIVMQTLSG